MKYIFNTFFYIPLYNGLVLFSAIVPGNDIGLAIILFTLFVKLVTFPLTHSSIRMQSKMREIEPEIKRIKEVYDGKQEEQALKMMELYRTHGVNPFTGMLAVFAQFPLIIGLYYAVSQGVHPDSPLLYSLTPRPGFINPLFLGLIDVTQASIVLGVIAGVLQYLQMRLSLPPLPKIEPGKEITFKDEFARSMNMQTRYIFPVMLVLLSSRFAAGLPLYWITNSVYAIAHELYVRRTAKAIK